MEAFQRDQAHKNMLRMEETKLNDQKMKKIHLRAKRLEHRRKKEIIMKELSNYE